MKKFLKKYFQNLGNKKSNKEKGITVSVFILSMFLSILGYFEPIKIAGCIGFACTSLIFITSSILQIIKNES